MTNMPHARVKTLEASLPTLVLEGRACLRRRRTHARGGSNSMVPAPGWAERVACLGAADADADADLVVESSGAAASAASAAEAAADDSGAGAGSGAAGASGIGLDGAGLLIFVPLHFYGKYAAMRDCASRYGALHYSLGYGSMAETPRRGGAGSGPKK